MNPMSNNISDAKWRIIRWTEAKNLGLKQYYTGSVCKHGHDSPRDVSDRACYECKLIKSAKWKHKNPDKHNEAAKKWVKKNPESVSRTKLRIRAKDPKKYWATSVFQNARKRAFIKNVPFELTKQDIYDLAGSHCPVFGIEFIFSGNSKVVPSSPSLDRIIPEKGYVKGNVAVISMKANVIKQNATYDEILKVSQWLKDQVE